MPATKEFSYRLEVLDTCLRRFGKQWDIEALLEEVNEKLEANWHKKIAKRTLFNDLKHLVNELHAPLEKRTENGKVYYSYSDKDFSIRKLPLASEEVSYLRELVPMLRQIGSLVVIDDIEAVIKKLEHAASVTTEATTPAILFEQHIQASGSQFLDDLLQAIRTQLPLHITYQSFQMAEAQIWCIHPYLLKEYRGRWFLMGRKDDSPTHTVLALDRIQKLKPATCDFIPNTLFDPQSFFHSLIGVSVPAGEVPQEILIRVKGIQCYYVRTKPIHTSQEIVAEEEDCMTVRLTVFNNYELRSHLLSYGPSIEVLSPSSLREQMGNLFQEGLQAYN